MYEREFCVFTSFDRLRTNGFWYSVLTTSNDAELLRQN